MNKKLLQPDSAPKRSTLKRFAWLSLGVAFLSILLKLAAYLLTGSVGLLSDALEGVVNIFGGLMALAMINLAEKPADDEHAFGHTKAEYFSSAVEGLLICIASVSIMYTAVERIINPQPVEQLGIGLAVSVAASLLNLGVALILARAARQHNSITLKANSQHLMTDVWTSLGVVVAVGMVSVTGWQILDPLIAIAVALNIIISGVRIIRESAQGLLDTAIPTDDLEAVAEIFKQAEEGIIFHALRSRMSGMRKFISFHVLVPGEWTVEKAHLYAETIESAIREKIRNVTVFTHIEPNNDPRSWHDIELDYHTPPEDASSTSDEQ
jgi:cation diffusion facilitator family transporter